MSALRVCALLVFLVAGCGDERVHDSSTRSSSAASSVDRGAAAGGKGADGEYEIRGLANKCVDVGSKPGLGSSVVLNRCNQSSGQRIRILETEVDRHIVVLMHGDLCLGSRQPAITAGAELELQICNYTPWQRFAIDGDSILLEYDHQLVVAVKGPSIQDGTPLVFGKRRVEEEELWRFDNVDDPSHRPTSGFVRVDTAQELVDAVAAATWGSVIEVHSSFEIRNTTISPQAGVTIRGRKRHGIFKGAEIHAAFDSGGTLFEVRAGDVRIAGLRLRSTLTGTSDEAPKVTAIALHEPFVDRSFVDHNDISNFGPAIGVMDDVTQEWICADPPLDRTRAQVRVARNNLHDNVRDGAGYGVVTGKGGFADVEANTFDNNRHAIASDGRSRSGYRALYNLVLSRSPEQSAVGGLITWYTQDFDVHGRDNGDNTLIIGDDWELGSYRGGRGGDYFEIGHNTFLASNRESFDLRGTPCRRVDFHHNVSANSESSGIGSVAPSTSIVRWNNAWTTIQMSNLWSAAAGDFDGDGFDDVFMTSGAAWYYSSGGQSEWRLLNRETYVFKELRFGDFDGDGRTDVLVANDNDWLVSWGGVSPLEHLRTVYRDPLRGSASDTTQLKIADFDGDGTSDVALHGEVAPHTDAWFVSYAGRTALQPWVTMKAYAYAGSCFFGHFQTTTTGADAACKGSDSQWYLYDWGSQIWRPQWRLQQQVTHVADIGGEGYEDAVSQHDYWTVGRGLTQPYPWGDSVQLMGQFEPIAGASALWGKDGTFRVASLETAPYQRSWYTMF